jgi:hypothetical protein
MMTDRLTAIYRSVSLPPRNGQVRLNRSEFGEAA